MIGSASMSPQTRKRLGLVTGVLGAGAVVAAIAVLARRQGKLDGLGRLLQPKYRFAGGRHEQAPVVGRTTADGMTMTHRRSAHMPIEERVASIQDLVWKGVQDPRMRKLALQITKHCPERDGQCEAKAVYDYVKRHVRYTGDVAPVKMGSNGPVEGVDLFQSGRRTLEFQGGDCLPASTLVLRADFELIPLIELEPGDQIMGDAGHWTRVEERWLTGEKELLEFELSNGCILRCTPEHRIFRNVDGREEEIRASEARIGDDLITGSEQPFADPLQALTWPEPLGGLSGEDLHWLLGVFVADGWADGKRTRDGWHPYRVGISGRDGHVKEAQKRRVVELMESVGVTTRWHERYVAINDSSLARFFADFGKGAAEKHVSLNLTNEADAKALLQGLAADADRRSGVYGATSPLLALQLRVLYRMLGQSVHIKRVDEHGGLGKQPIYRVTPRSKDNDRRDVRFARIRSISDGGVDFCMDLTTSTGRFWLPESDVVVHNCDDHSTLGATLLAHNGITPLLRVTASSRNGDDEHIYVGAVLPKGANNGKFVALDTTLPGDDKFGVELPRGRTTDFPA